MPNNLDLLASIPITHTIFLDIGKGFKIALGSHPDLGTLHKTEENRSSSARAVSTENVVKCSLL